MATASITDEDREALRKGVTGAGMLVALSDRSFFDTFREAGALAQHLAKARESNRPIIRELAEGSGTGFGLTASPDEVERETLASLRSALTILQTKSPQDVEPYKQFVRDVASSVSRAAGGGDAAESEAIQKLERALT
jgi:hypothetical protein